MIFSVQLQSNTIKQTKGQQSLQKCQKRKQLTIRAQNVKSQVPKKILLGTSGIEVSSIGIGAWSWGDRTGYWGYDKSYAKADNQDAYAAISKSEINLIDTAEVYGFGQSEEFCRDFRKATSKEYIIATKFAPLPWRFVPNQVVKACQMSLERLDQKKVGLYQVHWPGFAFQSFSNDNFVEGLAMCKQQGLTDAVGISNFRQDRVRKAHEILAKNGIPLATNQVQYSLLYRAPERNGVLETCKELGVTLIAYSPICQGLLSGKYNKPGAPKPSGPRAQLYNQSKIKSIQTLLDLMEKIGQNQGGKSPAQVAINWLLCKGVLPIPGAKNAKQVEELVGAWGWKLDDGEVMELESASSKIQQQTGAPFENW